MAGKPPELTRVKEPLIKEHILYDSIFMKYPDRSIFRVLARGWRGAIGPNW